MPYIKENDRKIVDGEIQRLLERLAIFTNYEIEGALNYTITSLLPCLKRGEDLTWKYRWLNRVVGTLECVKLECYRRLIGPYENSANLKNGDIPIYSGEVN